MAPEYVFLVFHGADLTTVENRQQIPNLPSPTTRLEVTKDDGEDDGNSNQEGREELYQNVKEVI